MYESIVASIVMLSEVDLLIIVGLIATVIAIGQWILVTGFNAPIRNSAKQSDLKSDVSRFDSE